MLYFYQDERVSRHHHHVIKQILHYIFCNHILFLYLWRDTLFGLFCIFGFDQYCICILVYYIDIQRRICAFFGGLLFCYKTLWAKILLAWYLEVLLLECEARFSCHLKIIPCQKLVWDSTSLCKMELILEVSVTRVRDSSAMVNSLHCFPLLSALCE